MLIRGCYNVFKVLRCRRHDWRMTLDLLQESLYEDPDISLAVADKFSVDRAPSKLYVEGDVHEVFE
jgi:hypothetical protein